VASKRKTLNWAYLARRLHASIDGTRTPLQQSPDDHDDGCDHEQMHETSDNIEPEPEHAPQDEKDDTKPDQRGHENLLDESTTNEHLGWRQAGTSRRLTVR
jgi:hypothetical protein